MAEEQDEEVEDREDAVKVEEVKTREEVEVKTEVKETEEEGVKDHQGGQATPDTRPKDMLTLHHLSHVFAIGPLENQLIFVRNLAHALGRMSGCQNQINETVTSQELVKNKTTNSYIICCTTKDRK